MPCRHDTWQIRSHPLCWQVLQVCMSLRNSCRTDSRLVSHCDEEDAKLSVSKTSSSKSANHSSRNSDTEVEKKNRTASGSRSHSSQGHSKTLQGGTGSCRSKSPKAHRSSSRSRSPSSRRHSRKHSPKRTSRRHSKRVKFSL